VEKEVQENIIVQKVELNIVKHIKILV
jgi:hypothetical protein